VFLARKFYNDAVSATRVGRRRPLARALRLAGKAAMPEYFEMDDSLAEKALPGRRTVANRWPASRTRRYGLAIRWGGGALTKI
jgi:hypothetical protein